MKVVIKQDYDKSVKINHRDVKCYSRKLLKERYPKGNYAIVGETFENNKKEKIDTINMAKKDLIVSEYGKNSKILYAKSGYIAVADNKYIVLLQNRVPFLLILLGIILFGVFVGIMGYKAFMSAPLFSPEYPLPPEDDQSTDIINDNSTSSDSPHKNHAAIKVAREVIVSLQKREVSFIYQNFNASNKDAVVTLCIVKNNNEYPIARSGLIKVGKEIKTMKIIDDSIKLTKGIYKGRIKIDFYNENTGEKAATSTDFDDVEITVK